MGLRLLALACLVGAAFAGPYQRQTSSSECATRCETSGNENFHYEPGKRYVYDFDGNNQLIVAGQEKQSSRITGQAEIHVKSKCDLVLRLKNVRIEQKSTQEEIDELTQKLYIPMHFAYQDGRVDHICPSEEESTNSLNIKKAFVSYFINTLDNLAQSQEVSEDDSLGRCQTKYTVRQEQNKFIIQKEKHLRSCTNRHSSLTALITNPYDSPDDAIHSAPIFPTDKLTCEQIIESGLIKSCKCKEMASLKALGRNRSLLDIKGQMDLKLASVQQAEHIPVHPSSSQQSLAYNLQESSSVQDVEHEVEELLKKKCSQTTIIDLSASRDFIFLVSSVKRLSYEALQRLYTSLENGRICSSKRVTDMFLDTLPMAGSDGAIRLMVNLLVQQRITGLKAKLWAASLALVNNPSHEAIKAVSELVKEQRTRSVLLGVSAMVYRHCLHNRCETSQSVKDIVTTLNQVLGQQCSFEDESQAVAVLKAFGNMGQILHAEKNILSCARDNDKSIPVRLAAIDAFRRVNETRPQEILQLYADPQVPYEVRIAALSSVIRYADERQIDTIKSVAEKESQEQVSAYAGTLIANMNKTSSPLRREVRERLNRVRIETPSVGYWENSKNIELSTFSDALNIGGGIETDIIHSPETHVPRSIHTKLDLDVFDNHLNVFEVGLRAEGLEAAFRKLIGFREGNQQKSSWNILRQSNEIDEDEKLEAQFFFRTMDTEVFDFSVSDLNSMSEIMQVADILNKLSHEKSADFSHSFMFVNSKLVIPSVTGRSYSFGLQGSATVGLVAKSKVDIVNILSRSKNCDVHGHFQPSVNVELAATVGMHSENPRPDIKIVTRVHSESHIEAQFKIKDSHLGLVKVSVPSENIAYTKISSDIFEIDADHQEKPIYDTMQKKIDYCFDKLEKPLGVSVCAKWEVPRPFMSKTFPFVKGVGNLELAIKKTDVGMRSYEMSVEIPKHKSSVMTYKASMDTPGSRFNRRFSADLEVRMPSREQKQISLQIKSPFRSARASATGSLTTREDLIEGTFEVQAGTSRQYSIRASAPISDSSSEKTYSPSIEVSSSSSTPLTVDGSVSLSKGRKQQIHFDLKANKPSRQPLALKGTIVKEGLLSTSKSSEWKLSSDMDLKSPIVNLNVRSSTEKQAKQSHKISHFIAVDYQTGNSRQESVKLTTSLQKSLSKISSVAQFETSKYPFANVLLTWNMQGKVRESLKSDVTLKYGTDPENQYVNILYSSRMHQSQPGECKVAIKAPQFGVDSDLTVSHDIEMNSRLHADLDLRYTEDKHVKGKLHVDRLSERPLKLKMKAEIQTPERRMWYQDELEETSPNSYKGNAVCEWGTGKRTELQYKYQRLSDRSKFHHEIETSLRLPSSQSPIKHKTSIEISSGKVGVEGRVSLNRGSEYTLKAQLNKQGSSYVTLKVPKLEGNLKLVNDDDKKAADLDLKSNFFRQSRHVTASASLGLGSQKRFETELCLNADTEPEDKYTLSASYENQPRNKFQCTTKLQISDKAKFESSTSGDRSVYGRHEVTIETHVLKFEPMQFTLQQELTPTKANAMVRYSKNQRPQTEISFGAERLMSRQETEISASASLKSLDNSFQSKKWSYKGLYSRSSQSRPSMTFKSTTRLQWSPSKVYEGEVDFNMSPNVVVTKAYLHTPHANFEKQSVGFSYRQSDNQIVSSASAELPSGKTVSISSETLMIPGDGLKSSLVISSPFPVLRDARIMVTYDNKPSQKNLKSTVDINGSRKADAEFSLVSSRATEIKCHVKTAYTPEYSAFIKCENDDDSFKYDLKVMKESSSLMSASLSKQSSNQDVSFALQSSSQDKPLVNIKMVKEMSPSSTKHKLEAQGAFPEISLSIESSQKDKNSLTASIEACHKQSVKSCYSVKGYHKALINEENYRFYRKFTVDMEKSSENSSPKSLASVMVISAISGNDFREKFTVGLKEKKIGYEVRLHKRDNEQDHCSLDSHIFTPNSTIRVHGSILHNGKSVLSDFEIIPDASVPSRKIGYELKVEKQSSDTTGYLKLYHPEVDHPMQVSGHISQDGIIPVSGKLRLSYSSAKGNDFILEVVPEQDRRQRQRQSITYKAYREDKSYEASAKLMKYTSRQEHQYSYEWVYKTKQDQKQGKLSLRLSEIVNGKPRVIDFEVATPKTSTKLNSRLTWESQIPTAWQCSLLSNDERIYDVEIKAEQDCLYVSQQLKSRPFMRHEVCVLKDDNQKMTLLSAQAYYQQRKSLDLSIDIDKHDSQFANIAMNWDARSFRQCLREVQQLCREMIPRYLSQEDVQSLKSKAKFWGDLLEEVFMDCGKKVREFWQEQQDIMQLYISKSQDAAQSVYNGLSEFLPLEYIKQEIIEPLSGSVKHLYERYTQWLSQLFDEHFRALWEKFVKSITESLRATCPQDTFCYDFANAIERMEVERMRMLIKNKVKNMKSSMSECLSNVNLPNIREFFGRLANAVRTELQKVMTAISEGQLSQLLSEYVHRLEHRIVEEAKEKFMAIKKWVLKMIAVLEPDADFQIFKSLFIEYSDKFWSIVESGESFIEKNWEPMCQYLRQYYQYWMDETMTVEKFSPQEGRISVHIRNPFQIRHYELLKNITVSMKNKIQSA